MVKQEENDWRAGSNFVVDETYKQLPEDSLGIEELTKLTREGVMEGKS
jgi:hypothetical protein